MADLVIVALMGNGAVCVRMIALVMDVQDVENTTVIVMNVTQVIGVMCATEHVTLHIVKEQNAIEHPGVVTGVTMVSGEATVKMYVNCSTVDTITVIKPLVNVAVATLTIGVISVIRHVLLKIVKVDFLVLNHLGLDVAHALTHIGENCVIWIVQNTVLTVVKRAMDIARPVSMVCGAHFAIKHVQKWAVHIVVNQMVSAKNANQDIGKPIVEKHVMFLIAITENVTEIVDFVRNALMNFGEVTADSNVSWPIV